MARLKANGQLVKELRLGLDIDGKNSQGVVANLSADRNGLAKFKGEEPPAWLNVFSPQWLGFVETKPEQKFEEGQLRSLAYILGTTLEVITFGASENPYKGLQAFGIEDAEFFGGRREEARAVFERLQSHNLVGIIGASGSGKSSLAFAGVCPLISDEQPDWKVLPLRIGKKPLENLFYALDQWLFPNADQKLDRPARIRKFEENLKQGDDALYHYLTGAQQDMDKTPVLLLDQ